ncbi:anthrone oxygenase family protein [Streptomyces sp. NPDC005438]|uniref:anthrone oxygenase family protein n=1 Tax=Streptomyces sp. NPDC005438 TaxID=3156880 RepID=UPI0033B6F23C
MLRTLQGLSLMAAVLTTGLSAGLYYGVAVAVMPGLAQGSDHGFVEGMRGINRAILNGWFLLLFGGSLVFLLLAGALQLAGQRRAALPWIVAALVLYAGVLLITFRYHIPLNDALEKGGLPESADRLHAAREAFEAEWTRWNRVRAVCNTAAFASAAWALVRFGTQG